MIVMGGCDLMREVLLGSTHILRTPQPTVTIKDLSADMIDFELGFSVADIGVVDDAKNEVFDRAYRAATAAGIRFASRLAPLNANSAPDATESATPARLIAGISLFSTLTESEKAALAVQMIRKDSGAPGFGVTRSYLPSARSVHAFTLSSSCSSRMSKRRARSAGSSTGIIASTRRWKLRGIQSALPMYISSLPPLEK